MFGRLKTALSARLAIKPSYTGPTQSEYFRDISAAYVAGYEAGQMNKQIHDIRAYLAQHVGE